MKKTKASGGANVIVGAFVITLMAGAMVLYLLGYVLFLDAFPLGWREAFFAFMPLGAILLYLYWQGAMLLVGKMDEFGAFGGRENE